MTWKLAASAKIDEWTAMEAPLCKVTTMLRDIYNIVEEQNQCLQSQAISDEPSTSSGTQNNSSTVTNDQLETNLHSQKSSNLGDLSSMFAAS